MYLLRNKRIHKASFARKIKQKYVPYFFLLCIKTSKYRSQFLQSIFRLNELYIPQILQRPKPIRGENTWNPKNVDNNKNFSLSK